MILKSKKVELHRVKRKGDRVVWMMRWRATDGRRYGETIGDVEKITKREALRIIRERQSGMDTGQLHATRPTKRTLSQFRDYIRDAARTSVRPRTVEAITQAFDHAIAALGAEIHVASITPAHVGRIKAYLVDTRKRSNATVHKTLSHLRAAFQRGIKLRVIHDNPFQRFDLRPVEAKQARLFTRDEIDAMIQAAPSEWWRAFIRLAFTSGLRRDELLHLRWDDIDLESGVVQVRNRPTGRFSIDGQEYPMLAWSAKSRSSYRAVPIPADTAAALRAWRKRRTDAGNPYLFLSLQRLQALAPDAGGTPRRSDAVLVNNALRGFRSVQRAAFGDDCTLGSIHDLRKSYGTILAGVVPMHVLKEYMGHSTIGTTAKFYTRVQDSDAAKVREAMAGKPALRLAS